MNKTWLRLALAGLAVTSVGGALAIGCTGDDTTPAVLPDAGKDQNVVDTGNDVVTPPADGGDAAVLPNAKVVFVHASPDAPALRVCLAVGTKNDGSDGVILPAAPLPDTVTPPLPYAGFFPGTGGFFPDLPLDLSTKAVTIYGIVASKITTDISTDAGAAPVACDTLIETDAGLAATDIIKLPTLPIGTLAKGSTLMMAFVGCLPAALDANASVALCGSTWTAGAGNLAIKGFAVDTKVASSTKMGVQVAHFSSQVEGKLQGGSTNGVNTAVFDSVADAGVSISVGQKFGELKPATAASNALGTAAASALVITVNNPLDGGAPVTTIPVSFQAISKLSTGVLDAGYFQNGKNYAFAVMGDPTAPTYLDDAGTIFNGYSFHVLAFPVK